MRPAIIVHGGAGTIEDERRAACVAGVERAAQAGWAVLEHGGSALDAVEAATRAMEDDPEFNAGYGGVLNRMGILETDACIMDGRLRAGAVGAVPWMRHPVTLARRLLEGGEHVFLVGGGALLYAREQGFPPDPPETMISPRARRRHEEALAAEAARQAPKMTTPGDTVGAVAVDRDGHVAAATSTGGTSFKRSGRVGDSPLPGCGNYADDQAGAASATGHGESIIRVVMCKGACDRLRVGQHPDEAARAAVKELVERTGGEGGIILVDTQGRVGHFTSTPRMPWAAVVGGERSSGAEHE
jgi:beta-aspartyl-peptidase (threonine type)